MLAFADGARKSEAALDLISRERDVKMLREAIEVLRAEGRWRVAHASCMMMRCAAGRSGRANGA